MDGKQSMRVAVTVDKADLASACGMEITYKGKTQIIATDTGYKNIYDYDENQQKVVYTAVITNIPSTAFADEFAIRGLVKGIGAQSYTKSPEPVKKSIDSVVGSLGQDYKLAQGVLVKKLDELDITDVSKIKVHDAGITTTTLREKIAVRYKCPYEITTYKGRNCLKLLGRNPGENRTSFPGLSFVFDENEHIGRKFWVEMDACSPDGYKFRCVSASQIRKLEPKDEFLQASAFITGQNVSGYLENFSLEVYYTAQAADTTSADLYVASYSVWEVVTSLPQE